MTLPLVSSKELINTLKRAGFKRGPKKPGSHQVYVKVEEFGDPVTVTVIEGKKQLPRPTLKGILERAEIKEKEFVKLLKKKK